MAARQPGRAQSWGVPGEPATSIDHERSPAEWAVLGLLAAAPGLVPAGALRAGAARTGGEARRRRGRRPRARPLAPGIGPGSDPLHRDGPGRGLPARQAG